MGEVDYDGVKIHTHYKVVCKRDGKEYRFLKDMSLTEDHGELVIFEHDYGLSWSDEVEKALGEKINETIFRIIPVGTYIN